MKKIVLLICCFLWFSWSYSQKSITVAVAANMQYTVEALVEEFNKTHSTEVKVVIGASGNLTQQILNGAPFDIFISADSKSPNEIYKRKKSIGKPKIYARGVLVIWTNDANLSIPIKLVELTKPQFRKIAIANPDTAPYGFAAVEVLKKAGIYEKVKSKLVMGENISQTSQFIATKNANIGFTAKSIVLAEAMNGKGSWKEIPIDQYSPINQSAVLLKNKKEALDFYQYLFSASAQPIYKKFGYLTP